MCRIKRSDKAFVRESEEIKEVWRKNFESVMNESVRGRAEVGVQINVRWPYPEGEEESRQNTGTNEAESREGSRYRWHNGRNAEIWRYNYRVDGDM